MKLNNEKIEIFLKKALEAKQKLEEFWGPRVQDKSNYIYSTLLKIIKEVETNQYPPRPRRTDLGVAAIKFFDSEDLQYLYNLISDVEELYELLPDK